MRQTTSTGYGVRGVCVCKRQRKRERKRETGRQAGREEDRDGGREIERQRDRDLPGARSFSTLSNLSSYRGVLGCFEFLRTP